MNKQVELFSISNVFNDHYSIPLYQRSFAWGTDQIKTLLQDIYSCYLGKKDNKDIPYYVGSLVVKKVDEGRYEVIDGQQRLTFFTLLTKILGINKPECRIKYESRDLEQEFLDKFYEDDKFYNHNDVNKELKRRNVDLIKAIYDIQHVSLVAEGDEIKTLSLNALKPIDKEKFIKYVQDNVFLLRTEISKNTDVTSYFEIMNNRGKQLQKQEILKSIIMSGLGNCLQHKKFGMIWDACSQMHRPIQKSFLSGDRKEFFGEEWNSFISLEKFKEYFRNDSGTSNKIFSLSFEDLLKKSSDPFILDVDEDEDEIEESDGNRGSFKYQSIIDFSNFLMHVFKLFYDKNDEISLDEKSLMQDYKKIKSEVEPIEFLYRLFLTRTLFDRFIIKVEGNANDESDDDEVSVAKEDENFAWRLLEPCKYEYKKGKKTYYRLDFRTDTEFGDGFVKSLSMLQVTFRSRHHKNWLQELLKFLVNKFEEKKMILVDDDFKTEYLNKIHCYIRDYFNQNLNPQHLAIVPESKLWNEEGTSTPHFLFNLIDYLYWLAKANNLQNQFPELKYVKDFNFRYHNSVEHHWPQHFEGKDRVAYSGVAPLIDNLGNLCLISKGTNSQLQNASPEEKVKNRAEKAPEVDGVKAFPPKREIMYSITKEKNKWEKSEIEEHYKNVLELLNGMPNLLDVEPMSANSVSSIINIESIDDPQEDESAIVGNALDCEKNSGYCF